jgi:hypothetical protein
MELAECGAFRDDSAVPRVPLRSTRATQLLFVALLLTACGASKQRVARRYEPQQTQRPTTNSTIQPPNIRVDRLRFAHSLQPTQPSIEILSDNISLTLEYSLCVYCYYSLRCY